MQFILITALFAAAFVLVILPQQKRLKAQRKLVASLEVGDVVISSAGIHGRVVALGDDIATLEVAPGVELRFARAAMVERLQPASEVGDGSEDADSPADTPAETTGDPANAAGPAQPGADEDAA